MRPGRRDYCLLVGLLMTVMFLTSGCQAPAAPANGVSAGQPNTRTGRMDESMVLQSPAFADGSPIPERYSGYGKNISPALFWDRIPVKAKSLTLVCADPDAPNGTWVHWIVVDLPVNSKGIPEGGPLPAGAKEVVNSFGRTNFGGPHPPSDTHRYFFTLYALDVERIEGLQLDNYEVQLSGHVLDHAQWMGTFTHKE